MIFFLVCVGQGHNGSSLLGLTHMPTLPNPFSSLPSWEHKAAAYCISVSAKYIHLHCREDTPAGHPKGSSPNELFFNTKLITFPPLLPSLLLHLFSRWRRSPSYQPRSQAGGVIFPTLRVCEKTSSHLSLPLLHSCCGHWVQELVYSWSGYLKSLLKRKKNTNSLTTQWFPLNYFGASSRIFSYA